MKKSLFLILALLIIQLTSSFCQIYWQHTDGPFGSQTSHLAANDTYVFLPEDDFLYRSLDGILWEKINHPVSSYFAVYKDTLVCLRYDEDAEQLLFQISPDNGETWTIKTVPSLANRFFDLGMCSHGIYWISWDKDLLYKSTDLGDTWVVDTLIITSNFKRLNIFDDKLYVSSDSYLWRSDTLGENWENITPPLPPFQYLGALIVIDSHIITSTEEYLLSSHDQGQTWDTVFTSYAAIPDKFALIGNDIYVNQHPQLLLSKDYGKNWDTLFSNTLNYNIRGVLGFRDMLLISTYEKGVFRLDSMSNTFIESNEGLSKGVIYDLASGKDKIWAACGNGIFTYNVIAESWDAKMALPLQDYGFGSVSANDEGWVFVAAKHPPAFYFSKNHGQAWDTLYPALVGDPYDIRVQIIDDLLFIGSGSYIYRSVDEGQQWEEILQFANYRNPDIVSFNEKLYVAGYGELYVSSDLGENWLELNLPFNTVEVHAFGDHLYAVTLNTGVELYMSNDGQQWTQASEGLEEYGYYGAELLGYQPAFFFRDADHHYAMLGWQGHFSSSIENVLWSSLPTSRTGYAYLVHEDVLYLGREGMYTTPIENPFVTAVKDTKEDKSSFSITPNPTNEFIRLSQSGSSLLRGRIEIYSVDGILQRSIEDVHFNPHSDISVVDLPPGKYFVSYQSVSSNAVQSFVIVR